MAKRNRKKTSSAPNISQETLDRVRRETGNENAIPEDAEEARKKAERRAERAARRAARQQRGPGTATTGASERPKNRSELSANVVAEMLAHPTAQVSEEELKVQYGYVIADLRNMGILAGILLVVLIGLGFLV